MGSRGKARPAAGPVRADVHPEEEGADGAQPPRLPGNPRVERRRLARKVRRKDRGSMVRRRSRVGSGIDYDVFNVS